MAQADIFTINEPFSQAARISKKELSRYKRQATKHGSEIFVSKHQVIYIKHRLATRYTVTPTSAADGRIISHKFQLQPRKQLLLVSIYVVAVDDKDKSNIASALNKISTRREIIKELDNIKRDFLARAKDQISTPSYFIKGAW